MSSTTTVPSLSERMVILSRCFRWGHRKYGRELRVLAESVRDLEMRQRRAERRIDDIERSIMADAEMAEKSAMLRRLSPPLVVIQGGA